ncbi:MAG TPA: Mur ligase family protein [Thermoanaerobaculaceae bacterium]|nr:Mur ligase family protein [Thermoanaerobaculaceae bacterium]
MEVTGSRWLLGPSLWLDGAGVVADVRVAAEEPDPVPPWRHALKRANAARGWPRRVHSRRTADDFIALAVEAPPDCLSVAARLNDWAVAGGPGEEMPSLVEQMATSSRPDQRAAIAQADERGLPWLLDSEGLTVGLGAGAVTVAERRGNRGEPVFARREVACLEQIPWDEVRPVPVALVTGTLGTTATARLLARIAGLAGHTVGLVCSDGVEIGGEVVPASDPTGPVATRLVACDPRVTFAILETSVDGILEHGLVLPRVDIAVITGVTGEPAGAHGVTTPQHMAEAALVVAKVARTLVLNADDPLLSEREAGAWFSLDHRVEGAWVENGELVCGDASIRPQPSADPGSDPAGGQMTVMLAAAAAGRAVGLPAGAIAEALTRHLTASW